MKLGWISAFGLLLACEGAASAGGPRSDATDLAAGEATVPVVASPAPYYPRGYAEMKAAAAVFAKENFGKYKQDNFPDEAPYYDVVDCQESLEDGEIADARDLRTDYLERLARLIAKHDHFMSQLYPPAVYKQALQDYEKAAIQYSAIESPEGNAWEEREYKLQTQLATAIERRRKQLARHTLPVKFEGGCGEGDQPYLVKATPPTGRVWMTTKFSWDLCRARKVDPWNTDDCRWTEVSTNNETYLAGRYVYQARWPDGIERRGLRAFEGGADPAKTGPTVVVIDRP